MVNYMNKKNAQKTGFSLMEMIVVVGILSLLIAGAFVMGFPEYNRYLIASEREYLIDTLLESRARSLTSNAVFAVKTWPNGYCIQDISNLCVVPFHNLPENISLKNQDLGTSTALYLTLEDSLKTEIIIDQNGLINGR